MCSSDLEAWMKQHHPNPKIAGKYEGVTHKVNDKPVWTGRINFSETALLEPLFCRTPKTYFVNSMSDLFHEDIPDEQIDRVFSMMALCPQHIFQVLTKRSQRMREYVADLPNRSGSIVIAAMRSYPGYVDSEVCISDVPLPLPNVWLGVSAEDQTRADERREDLRATPAAVKFVSYEPALGPVDWTGWEFVDQIISGGESGPGSRPSHPDWHRATRDFCADNGIAYFFKQWGDWFRYGEIDAEGHQNSVTKGEKAGYWHEWPAGEFSVRIGKAKAGAHLDGREHREMPL